ncbi:MAG TPA: patatin-like phospholipase RssA [Burkholderiaceae bacterium]|jgi:NTE family protein|nr:patatin-like phospholipase RssA [Burkholderiaceae bacterium]
MVPRARKPIVGLALGSGSARGWAHIGVIRTLENAGIRPDIICGTSIGALVGAAYGTGELDRFSEWVSQLKLRDVVSLMDFHLNGGMLKGERLMGFFQRHFMDCPVSTLKVPFAAVATDLHSGQEVWLKDGSTTDVVRASIALPGLFSPVWHDGRLLVDGGLVNPVPVSLARAMGADIVLAVDLNADILGRHTATPIEQKVGTTVGSAWRAHVPEALSAFLPGAESESEKMPSLIDILAASINIMQVRITRSRMAGDPADAVIAPRLANLGLMDFHRAKEAIAKGELAAKESLPALARLGLGG